MDDSPGHTRSRPLLHQLTFGRQAGRQWTSRSSVVVSSVLPVSVNMNDPPCYHEALLALSIPFLLLMLTISSSSFVINGLYGQSLSSYLYIIIIIITYMHLIYLFLRYL